MCGNFTCFCFYFLVSFNLNNMWFGQWTLVFNEYMENVYIVLNDVWLYVGFVFWVY